MGGGTFDYSAYRSFSQSTVGKSTDEVYRSRYMDKTLDPLGVKLRESRDSADNPNATPIIVGLDVTGSMGILADNIARNGLGTLFNGILDRKPVPDPHVMFMGIGDANYDRAPLQVSQFEADNRIVDQLTKLWLEKGGGGNGFESYNFAWYFAAFHTEHDAYIKRGRRGYLFTVGDEEAPGDLTNDQVKRFCGDDVEGNLTTQDMLELAQRKYDVYHIMIAEGSHARGTPRTVRSSWADLLGEKAVWLEDYTALAETIVSIIEVAEGRNAKESAERWGGASGAAVLRAIGHLPTGTARARLPGKGA